MAIPGGLGSLPISGIGGISPLSRARPRAEGQDETPPLTEQEVESVLQRLANQSLQAVETVGLILDTPGAIARGVLAGDPLSGFNFDYDKRTSGEELLDAYGARPSKQALGGWGSGLAGFATEVVTDPLFLFQGGLSALSKAGKAARASDVLQYAPRAAMAKAAREATQNLPSAAQAADAALDAARSTMTGRSAIKRLQDARVPLTQGNFDVMPTVGDRLARYRVNLREAVDAAPAGKRDEIMRQIRDYLGTDEAVNTAMDERLGNLFGFGLGGPSVTFSPFGEKTTENILDAFDYLGQAAAWNPVTRYGASFVQQPLDGATKVSDQIDALRANKRIYEEGIVPGRGLATEQGQLFQAVKLNDNAKALLGADSLSSPQGNDFYLRLSEGKPTAQDLAILAETPELDAVLDNWEQYAKGAIDEAKGMGLRIEEYQDAYGNKYAGPRAARELDMGSRARGVGRRERAAVVEEMNSRNPALAFAGGSIDLREMSTQLPKLKEHAIAGYKSPFTDEQIGEEIMDFVVNKHGNPMITLDQATAAARGLRLAVDRAQDGVDLASRSIPTLERAEREAMAQVAALTGGVAGGSRAAGPAVTDAIARLQRASDELLQAREAVAAGPQPGASMASVPYPSPAQTIETGRVLRKRDPGVPSDVPTFSEHPLNAQMRYMVNHEVRKATARHVLDSIAENAKPGVYTQQAGGPMRSLEEVLAKHAGTLGFNEGVAGRVDSVVAEQVKARIARREGRPVRSFNEATGEWVENIDLSKYFVPEDFSDRLVKVSDFYNYPEAQEEVANMFNVFTTLFKGFTLAWPSKLARDAYSNLASIYLETGNAPGAIAGWWAASRIMAGEPDKAIGYLKKIPRYARYTIDGVTDTEGLLREFQQDVGRNGVLSGLATTDLLSTAREGSINQFVPGTTPVTVIGGFKELIPTGERSVGQMLGDFGTIRGVTNQFETRNPWLKFGEKTQNAIDSSARLGMFMSLMRQGVGPEQAASRVRSALVDYSSLTEFERHYMKNIFMWWSYQSRIGKYAADSLIANPGGRFGQMIRAVNDLQRPDSESGYVPSGIRKDVSVRLLDALQFNPGTTTYLKNIDLPGLDVINLLQPAPLGQAFPINVQETIANLAGQAHPAFKTTAELALDRDLFSGRPLAEARTSVDKIYQGLTGDPRLVNPVAKAVLQNTPGMNRFISMFGTILDPEVENPYYRAGKVAVNELSGLKFSDVDPEYEALDARTQIGDALKGVQRTFTQRFIPKDATPYLTADQILLNEVDKIMQQQAAEVNRRKRAEKELQRSNAR